MVAPSVGEELDEDGGLLPGSVPLGGKKTDVGKDKQGLETGQTISWEGGQDLWAKFCGGSYFEMATHSSILAWKIPWTKQPSRLQSIGSQESDMTE